MSRAGRSPDLEAGIDDLLSEPQDIDLARAVAELEEAAEHYLSRSVLESAAAVLAAGIAFHCSEDICSSTKRSGIPEERYVAVCEAVRSRPSLTSADPEYAAMRDCEVLYAVMPVFAGDGTPQRVLVRASEGWSDGWFATRPAPRTG